MSAWTIERVLFAAMLSASALSVGWYGFGASGRDRAGRSGVRAETGDATPYEPVAEVEEAVSPGDWPAPIASAHGEAWVYDLFTPPEIRWDPVAGKWVATPAKETAAPEPQADVPGVRLVSTQRVPFPLQLVGHVGGEGHRLGVFEVLRSGETLLAAAGREFPALGLKITAFSVGNHGRSAGEARELAAPVAQAEVLVGETGRVRTLTAGERAYGDERTAVVAVETDDGEARVTVSPGELLRAAGRSLRVERIELDPPSLVLRSVDAVSGGGGPVVLAPRPASAVEPTEDDESDFHE